MSTIRRNYAWNRLKKQQACTYNKHNYITRGMTFQSRFCWCLIIDLLMQHKIKTLNLIIRRWRTRETKANNTHIGYNYGVFSRRREFWVCFFFDQLVHHLKGIPISSSNLEGLFLNIFIRPLGCLNVSRWRTLVSKGGWSE